MKLHQEKTSPSPHSHEEHDPAKQARGRKLGKFALRDGHHPTEQDIERGFIKGLNGKPDKLIVDLNDGYVASYDV